MKQKGLFSFLKDVRHLVLVSFFIALYVVLSMFSIYITKELRFSLTFVPVAWSSAAFGPMAGALTGAFGDVMAWVVKPAGPYHPGFTISGISSGIIYGIFLYRKEITLFRVFLTALTMIVVVELGLNTFWLMTLYGSPFKVLIAGRLLKAPITLLLQMTVLYGTGSFLKQIAPNRIKGI